MSRQGQASPMLSRTVRLCAGAGAASLALFAALVALREALPLWALWGIAYGIVGSAMACVGGFAWIGLTLPRGAPWKSRALALSGGVVALLALAVALL
jgi:hypothetical protein